MAFLLGRDTQPRRRTATSKPLSLMALGQSSFLYLLGNIAARAAAFIMLPLYTHYLTPSEYGALELIELSLQVAGLAVGMGAIGEAMTRLYHDGQDQLAAKEVISTAMWITTFIGMALAAGGFIASSLLSSWLFSSTQYTRLLRVSFIAMALGSTVEVGLVYQRMLNRAGFYVTYSVLQLFSVLGLNVYLIAFRRMGLWGFVMSKLIVCSAGFAVMCCVVVRQVGWRCRGKLSREFISLAAPAAVGWISMFVIHFSDRFFLARYSTLAIVGVYALAYKFGFLVTYLAGDPFGKVWGATMFAHTSGEGWQVLVARVGRYLVFTVMLAGLAIVVFSRAALHLLATPAFMAGLVVVPIVVAAYILRDVGEFFKNLFYVNKRVIMITKITASCAVLNAALNVLLVRPWGMIGAAAATLLTWLVFFSMCWILAQREHRIPLGGTSIVLLAGLWVVCVAIYKLTESNMLTIQILGGVAILLLFVGTTWASGYFPHEEKLLIRNYISTRVHRLLSATG